MIGALAMTWLFTAALFYTGVWRQDQKKRSRIGAFVGATIVTAIIMGAGALAEYGVRTMLAWVAS